MALPTNTFRPRRYFRSKFREAKYLLAAEATDLQLESFEQLREYIKQTFGDIAVGAAFKVEQLAADEIIIRPGEAWNNGIPFVLGSGTDPMVIEGDLPADVSLVDVSRSISDVGGKKLVFGAGCPADSYSVIIEAAEEIVREAGTSGAVDPFLQGVNVGEGTEHKFRLVYKVHVVPTADLMSSPTYPLGAGVKHYVNEIEITPTAGNYYAVSSVDITPDINGADRQVVFKNAIPHALPYSNDASDFIFGKLIDSDGNILTITSITTADGGNNITMSLDRQVKPGSINAPAGLPVITEDVPYRLVKRDHYVSDSNGTPLGKRFMKVAELDATGAVVSNLVDLRTVSEINSFGTDSNVRLREGGIISWDTTTNLLSNSTSYEITIPGVTGKAQILPGSISLISVGDIAYVELDRTATVNYTVIPTVVPKTAVPSNVNVYILAERGTSRVYFPHNGSIGDGESGFLGGFGSELAKDLSRDNLTDMLTEVQMDEVFAETFDLTDDVDFTNTQSMTSEQFLKQFRAGSSARFIDYHAATLPDADPTDPWTLLGNGAYSSVALGLLSIVDSSVGDYVGYRRTESSLTPLTHSEHKLRLRMNSTAGGSNPFTYMLQDGATGKHFGLMWTLTDVSLIDGSGAVLQSFPVDTTGYHTYELVKIGSIAVQWYVDGVRRGITKYSTITTAGSANQIEWRTATASTVNLDIDYIIANIYTSIFQSKDIYRKGRVFYEANVLPAADTVAWTKVDGGGGITEVISNGKLVLTDNIATNLINYYRTESDLTRHGDTEVDLRVKINSIGISNFQKFGFTLEDGARNIAVWLSDVTGQLRVGLYNGVSGTTLGALYNLNYDEFVTIKVRKTRDSRIELLANNILLASYGYEELTDVVTNKKITFGSFNVLSEYVATIDYIQYNLPGDGALAASPVRDLMAVVNGDDPSPIIWASSDGGDTWFKATERTTVSIADPDESGASLLVRIGLSRIDSVLTDYGLYYNKTGFEVDGPFRFVTLTATAGQTVFELPFAYTPGVNELIVSTKKLSGDNRELFVTDDYIENDATHVTLTSPASAGDKFKFRVIFVTDPLVVPLGGAGFLGHDHDGSSGESDILNPTQVNVSGNLNVAGYINGASPLKLSGDNAGVKVGTGLGTGTVEQEIRTAAGGIPSEKLTRGTDSWNWQVSATGDIELYHNSGKRLSMPQHSDMVLYSKSPDLETQLTLQSVDTSASSSARLRLAVNNAAQYWDLHMGNSGLKNLEFQYGGSTKFALRSDGFFEYSRPTGTSVGVGGFAISGGSGLHTNSSFAWVAIPNNSVTIVTTGRPVVVGFFKTGGVSGNGAGGFEVKAPSGQSSYIISVAIERDGSVDYYTNFNGYIDDHVSGATFNRVQFPSSSVFTIDTPPAGTHTYIGYTFAYYGSVDVQTNMYAYEL